MWTENSQVSPVAEEPMGVEYETDFYGWANEQAALLRAGDVSALDLENIAEEIESLGRSEKRELVNRLAVLLTHLLKWRFQPERRGASWSATIREQRIRLDIHMHDNPSLKSRFDESYAQAYQLALIAASRETGLPETTFPPTPPFTIVQAMDPDFWPD
jgi:hypothetical protein